jgi:hypothetical protein
MKCQSCRVWPALIKAPKWYVSQPIVMAYGRVSSTGLQQDVAPAYTAEHRRALMKFAVRFQLNRRGRSTLMAIDHVSASTQYRAILREGGTHTFEIDAEDIDYRGLFERLQVITDPTQPFMLPPFDVTDAKVLEHPWRPSHAWEIVVEQVYNRKGHIAYCRTKDGRYRAVCSVPTSSASGK